MAEDDQKITVLNIVSVSFSGSTWVNLMLGAHEAAFSVGEMYWIFRNKAALCGLHGEDCPIWSQYDVDSDENPFVQISNITGKKILIVNNSQEVAWALDDPRIDAKYLWVIRDGRAVAASAMRKDTSRNIFSGAEFWKVRFLACEKRIAQVPQEKVMKLGYEACVADPAAKMTQVCKFLGIDFDPGMIDYDNKERHFIGGNLGVLSVLASQQKSDKLHALTPEAGRLNLDITKDNVKGNDTFDLSHYKKTDNKHFVDERWKTQLSFIELCMFGWKAGKLNRAYGYSRSTKR